MDQKNVLHTLKKFQLTTPTAILLGGVMIAASVIINGQLTKTKPSLAVQNQGAPVAQQATIVHIKDVQLSGEPYIGNANAPVTIAYWFDYQCPFCKKFEGDVLSQLIPEYVTTGKVKIVFKDFQFLGDDSQTAGLVERAVWEVAPEKFYAWHKAMFDKQDNENGGWGKKADILTLTKKVLGESVGAKVEQLMSSKAKEYQSKMDQDKAEGGKFGISGTPAVIIGNQLVSGAQPYGGFKQALDQELKK